MNHSNGGLLFLTRTREAVNKRMRICVTQHQHRVCVASTLVNKPSVQHNAPASVYTAGAAVWGIFSIFGVSHWTTPMVRVADYEIGGCRRA
jgi:hypothetical protein